jgi:hypothetical protein
MPIKLDEICEHERKYSVENLEKRFNDFINDKVKPYEEAKQGRSSIRLMKLNMNFTAENDIDIRQVKVGVSPSISIKLDIYSKERYPIHGVAYQCKQIEYETTFLKVFGFQNSRTQ